MKFGRCWSFVGVFGVVSSLALGGCNSEIGGLDANASKKEQVTIRYTAHEIPHIKADTFRAGGHGIGYAFARHNLCLFTEHMTTIRGERSAYFGETESYFDPFVAPRKPVNNLRSDFYHRYYFTDAVVADVRANVSEDVKDLTAGFVSGFNAYVAENGPEACRGEPWVKPISIEDMYKRQHQMVLLGSSNIFLEGIVEAAPPKIEGAEAGPQQPIEFAAAELAEAIAVRGGSNAYAFGDETTEGGNALVFANPHFPWYGAERVYGFQLTVGDVFNVSGSSLYGGTIPFIGTNDSVSWSLTYSTDQRFTFYRVPIDPEDPLSYVVDGEKRPLIAKTVSVMAKADDGSLNERSHTFYETHHGPVISAYGMTWTKDALFTVRDANRQNHRFHDQFLAIGKAKTVRDIKQALDDQLGSPYSFVTAADKSGEVMLANISVTANVPNEQYEACVLGAQGRAMLTAGGVYVLDGSRSVCDWRNAEGTPQAGIIPSDQRPSIFRRDYVVQSNDSHWIVNADPETYLTGFSRAIGDEGTPRGERTRISLQIIEDRLAGKDGLPGRRMSADKMHTLFYQARNFTAERMVDDLIADCEANPVIDVEGIEVDVSAACQALARWDRTDSLDSRGGHIFREFSAKLPTVFQVSFLPAGPIWASQFDSDDPVDTPSGLNVTDPMRQAFAQVVQRIKAAGIAFDARLGDLQSTPGPGEVPVSLAGGPYNFHKLYPVAPIENGYAGPIGGGDTHISLTTLTEDGPKIRMVISYSQSTEPTSAAYRSQLPLYSSGNWIDLPFSEADIEAQTIGDPVILTVD
ncbi:MAG: penicillin acylase family protein [Pseudomonadota bacterium]